MTTIADINENIDDLLNDIDDIEILEEVKSEYVPFEKNMQTLLQCDCLDSYLTKYEHMCKEENAVLTCFELDNVDELKKHIEENETSFEELKIETAQASCEALELIIFDLEEDY